MGVIDTRVAKGSPTGGDDNRGGRQAQIVFDVTTDNVDNNIVTVIRDVSIPQYPSIYVLGTDSDPGLFLDNRNAKRERDSNNKWKVTCNFKSEESDKSENQLDNPLLEPVTREWDTADEPIPFERDALGKAVVNTLGMPFDPPIESRRLYQIGMFVRNEATFDGNSALDFIDHVNADVFAGFQPGQVLVAKIRASERFHGTIGSYFVVTYVFWAREAGWLHEEPNRSFYQAKVPGSLTRFKRIIDDDKKPIVEPGYIDEQSIYITPEELQKGSAGGGKDPFYLEFTRFAPVALGPLGLA